MYELKSFLPQYNISPPNCMYEMKRLMKDKDEIVFDTQESNDTHKKKCVNTFEKPISTFLPDTDCVFNLDKLEEKIQQIVKNCLSTITTRQEKVLQQLQDLKNQLSDIRNSLGLCQKPVQKCNGYVEEILHDIVINAHPNFVPYALLALRNAWKDLFIIDVKTFTHSSIPDIGQEARDFEQGLNQKFVDNGTKSKVNVILVWKNCEHTEMITSPTMYVPIYGEVNIIRYLGRVGPAEYRYENFPSHNEIDVILDICYQLLRCNTEKSKSNMIRILSERLQKQKYFAGNKISIADIGVNSVLKRLPNINDKNLTPTLIEWRKRVKKITML